VPTPGVFNRTDQLEDNGHWLDHIQLRQNFYLLIEDPAFDSTFVPLSLSYQFFAKWKPGFQGYFGHTQELKAIFDDFNLELLPCQTIPTRASGSTAEEEEDFDEEQETETLKMSPIAQQICAFRDLANKQFNESAKPILLDFVALRRNEIRRSLHATANEWYTFPEKVRNWETLCAGFDYDEP
jgi:hypothetical protein